MIVNNTYHGYSDQTYQQEGLIQMGLWAQHLAQGLRWEC
jgi:hypothetical protein